jgi:predicted RecA/RadA family phage recombinase
MLVGSIFAVATADAANGATVEAETQGVFELTKLSARAWVAGNLIYWDDAAKLMTEKPIGMTAALAMIGEQPRIGGVRAIR